MPRPSPRLPYKPHSLLIPRRPNFSALLIHRIPLHRYKQKQTLKLSAHPRLAKLFPRAESKVDRNEKLKKVVKVERRVLGDHFAHLKSRSVVGRTRKVKVVRAPSPSLSEPFFSITPFPSLPPSLPLHLPLGI